MKEKLKNKTPKDKDHFPSRITKHEKMKREISRLATFPGLNPNPIVEIDLSGKVLYMNESAKRFFPGLRRLGLKHPFLKSIRAVAGRRESEEKKFISREVASGGRWYIQTVYRMESDSRIRIYATEITERKRAEETLRKAHEELEAKVLQRTAELEKSKKDIYHRNVILKLLTKTSSRKQYLDALAKLMRGWSGCCYIEVELFKEKEKTALGRMRPGDKDKPVAVIPILYKDETIGAIRFAGRRKETTRGGDVDFIKSLMPLIGEGLYEFNMADSINKSNELLDRIFQSTNVLIAYMDSRFNFIRANKAYADIGGQGPDFFAGKNYFDLYPNDGNEEVFREALETGRPYTAFARPFIEERHPEHGATYWDWNLQPLKDRSGKVEGLIFFLVDVTERKRAEENLLRTERELIEVKRLSDIGSLAATVAHELRNPLAAMIMASYNIRRKTSDPLLDKHIATIEKKINESGQIINNLLFYSRIKPPRHEKIDLRETIGECVAIMEDRRGEKEVSVENKASSPKEVYIDADPIQMKEVFSNILNNAYDSITKGRGKIEIGISSDDYFASVYVKDDGSGIKEEILPKVFDPFFTTKAKGTGLGLTVCRQIIDFHNGTIDIKSKESDGTTVTVMLPVRKENYEKENTVD